MTLSVDALQRQLGIELDAGFRAYLQAVPGGGLAPWDGVAGGAPESPPMIDDVPGVFRIGELVERMTPDEGEDDPGKLHFWHKNLLAHAYVIASSYGGDPVVQVARGRYAGRVLLTNHEAWYGGFQFLSGVVSEDDEDAAAELAEECGLSSAADFATLTTDQIVEILLHEDLDGAIELGDSFATFYRNLLAAHAGEDES